MSGWRKTLRKVLSGSSDRAIRFEDLRGLLLRLGFEERVKGSHHIFTKDDVPEILNLQPQSGMSKPYQVKQVREVIVSEQLAAEEDGDENGDDE